MITPKNDEMNFKNSEGYLDVPGGKIWYKKFFLPENQDKTPLIVLHGGPGLPHNYLSNLTQLSANNPVILYDQLGCGKSAIQGEHQELWVMFGHSEFTVTGNLIDYDRLNDLHLLKMPTLITCGRFDEARPESLQKIVKLLPNGRLVIFEKSAHIPHLEEPDKYLTVLAEFMSDT